MANNLHIREQETMETSDWRPWVILGLLAVVITFALFAY
jgi:hypothetical protein